MTGWIFALAATSAAAAAPAAPPARVQSVGAATAIIVAMERIDPAKQSRQSGNRRQTCQHGGGVRIDFY